MDAIDRQGFVAHGQLKGFQKKVAKSQEIIEAALAIAPAYVGISWGKDSIVLLHLTQSIAPSIPAISFTHPDRELIDNYAEVEQEYLARFPTQLINISIEGDHVPAKVRKARLWEQYPMALIGLRKEESKHRRITCTEPIKQYKAGHWRATPLGDWSTYDVWAYIVRYELPYLKSYDVNGIYGRTTDHISRSVNKSYQATRLEEIKRSNHDYYRKLTAEIFTSES